MRVRYDLTAPDNAHFGMVRPIEEVLGDIPGVVDLWDSRPADMAVDGSGGVSLWTGRLGLRTFSQSSASLRPIREALGLRFYDPATGEPSARLHLDGTAIAAPTALSVAIDAQIASGQTGADLQALWGNSSPATRLYYRSGNGGHLMLQWGGNSGPNVLTYPLPADHGGRIRAVLTASAATVTLQVDGAPAGAMAAPGTISLPLFYLASSQNSLVTLRGHIRRFGMWQSALSATEVDAAMSWLR